MDNGNRDLDTSDVGGSLATINQIILEMQKMGTKMRDLERSHAQMMQRVAFDRQILSLETKREAIEQNYQAALAGAITQIVGGAISSVAALSGSQIATTGADGLSKSGQGIAGVASSGMTREAQQLQLQGDFEQQSAEAFNKMITTAQDRASEASRQMLAIASELVALSDRIASSVRMT
ncbi:pathogenicity island effector protein [Enterobacterales bacterium CwR94]|nr:pathogenicity island effector protein [Enterobacterales bacterium CwR94]